MIKYRLELTKGEPVRYISHLDYAGLMQRAICRAKLPAAYSEGFNPHMKIAFASALSVGVTSNCEYMDLELTKDICQPELFDRLRANLPPGVELLQVREISRKAKALMSIVDEATYEMVLPAIAAMDKLDTALNTFNRATELTIVRQTPKKTKEIEIKQYLSKPLSYTLADGLLTFTISISITPSGTVKPHEVLEALAKHFDLPLDLDEALCTRTGLFHQQHKLIDITE